MNNFDDNIGKNSTNTGVVNIGQSSSNTGLWWSESVNWKQYGPAVRSKVWDGLVVVDNGHGVDTPGKRSPDGEFREYKFTREVALNIVSQLTLKGIRATLLVPEKNDVSLSERCRRVNHIVSQLGSDKVILLSVHVNAAGDGRKWSFAKGWEAYTSPGHTEADILAEALYKAAPDHIPYLSPLRKDMTDGDSDKEARFQMLTGTRCPAVLTENLFMDNMDEVEWLQTRNGVANITMLHVDAIISYLLERNKRKPVVKRVVSKGKGASVLAGVVALSAMVSGCHSSRGIDGRLPTERDVTVQTSTRIRDSNTVDSVLRFTGTYILDSLARSNVVRITAHDSVVPILDNENHVTGWDRWHFRIVESDRKEEREKVRVCNDTLWQTHTDTVRYTATDTVVRYIEKPYPVEKRVETARTIPRWLWLLAGAMAMLIALKWKTMAENIRGR